MNILNIPAMLRISQETTKEENKYLWKMNVILVKILPSRSCNYCDGGGGARCPMGYELLPRVLLITMNVTIITCSRNLFDDKMILRQ